MLHPSKRLYPSPHLYPSGAPRRPNPLRNVPKLKVPLQMDSTGLATVEQGSDDEIAACVYAIIATPRDSRLEEADYGVEDASFEDMPPAESIDEWLVQIGVWEPRAEVSTAEEVDDLLDRISVQVGLAE